MIAYCQRCGTKKQVAISRCKECGYDPRESEDEMLKAVYLSSGRFEDPERSKEYESALSLLGRAIREGELIDYETDDIERLRTQKNLIDSIPASTPWIAVVRLFAPGILSLAVLFGILWLLRALK